MLRGTGDYERPIGYCYVEGRYLDGMLANLCHGVSVTSEPSCVSTRNHFGASPCLAEPAAPCSRDCAMAAVLSAPQVDYLDNVVFAMFWSLAGEAARTR